MQFLTVNEISAITKLSPWAVRRAIGDGELAAAKLRGRLRIDAVDFQAWVDGSRVAPALHRREPEPAALTPSPIAPEAGSVRARLRQERSSER